MSKEFPAELPKFKWKIIDQEKAEKAKIKLLEVDNETSLLEINVMDIPKGWTVANWISFLQVSNIIVLDK